MVGWMNWSPSGEWREVEEEVGEEVTVVHRVQNTN